MPRKVQDIIPGERRSIRNISKREASPVRTTRKEALVERRAEKRFTEEVPIHIIKEQEAPVIEESVQNEVSTPKTPRRSRKPRQWKWLSLALGITIVIMTIGFVASHYFSKATFTLIPRNIPVHLDSTYVTQSTPGTGIAYDLVSFHGTATTTIPATSGAAISTKAQGKVTFYNAYSAQSQRLIAGTRIASDASGLIYRLASSVSVPGYTSKGGSIIPGSISTTISADKAGDAYNISGTDSISDFKVISYKGSTKYDTVYARITGPITGGFIGTKKNVDPTILASTTITLQNKIIANLLAQASNTIPAGYVMYPQTYITSFAKPTVGGTDPSSALVTVQGTVYIPLFNKTDIASHGAGATTTDSFKPYGFTTPGIESLSVNIVNTTDFSPEKKGALILRIKGDFKIIGSIPVTEITKKLIGIPLVDIQKTLHSYAPVIKSASGEVTPPWAPMPRDSQRISIVVQDK